MRLLRQDILGIPIKGRSTVISDDEFSSVNCCTLQRRFAGYPIVTAWRRVALCALATEVEPGLYIDSDMMNRNWRTIKPSGGIFFHSYDGNGNLTDKNNGEGTLLNLLKFDRYFDNDHPL